MVWDGGVIELPAFAGLSNVFWIQSASSSVKEKRDTMTQATRRKLDLKMKRPKKLGKYNWITSSNSIYFIA